MSLDRANSPGVPEDFPVTAVPSAVAGAQHKMNLVEEGGKFYAPDSHIERAGIGHRPKKMVALASFEVTNDLRRKTDPVIPSHGLIDRLELTPSARGNRCRLIDIDLRRLLTQPCHGLCELA